MHWLFVVHVGSPHLSHRFQVLLAAKRLQKDFAGAYAKVLMQRTMHMEPSALEQLQARCRYVIDRGYGVQVRVVHPPSFWVPEQANYKNLGKYRPEERHLVYGSDSLEWVMCLGDRLASKPVGNDAMHYLSKLLRTCCPSYLQVLKRFGPATLLFRNNYNLDLAFLEGVWRYTAAVGRACFPQGLYAWPPPDDWSSDARCFDGQSTWCGGVPCASDDAAAASVPPGLVVSV